MTRRTTTLFFAPTKQYVEAHIVDLTPDLAKQRLYGEWGTDGGLLDHFRTAANRSTLDLDRHGDRE
jgi:hypothetical protein